MKAALILFAAGMALAGCDTSVTTTNSLSGYEVVVAQSAADATTVKQVRADCPPGKKALGAGAGVLDPTDAILEGRITYSEPAFDGSHWLVNASNASAFAPSWKLRVRLICATVTP